MKISETFYILAAMDKVGKIWREATAGLAFLSGVQLHI
jgi:hypothetical protein